MNVFARLVGFLVVLVAVFGAAVGVGRAVGPVPSTAPADHREMAGDAAATDPSDVGSGGRSFPKGLTVSQNGYTLRLARTTLSPGTAVPVALTIQGPDGTPVTEYDVEHEKALHVIAVRRDVSGFQHVHPVMAENGTWTTSLDLTAGQWRVFADFKPAGAEAVTLGSDVALQGVYRPARPPADSLTWSAEGYTVSLHGDLSAGEEAELTLTVTHNGKPVTNLEPYLGAYGHMVALRAGDLAYLHVHPEGRPDDGMTGAGPDVVFHTQIPSAGRYHLYLDFKHEGVVRTAEFTVTASSAMSQFSDVEHDHEDEDADEGHFGDGH